MLIPSLLSGTDRALVVSKMSNEDDGTITLTKTSSIAVHEAPVLCVDIHPTQADLVLSSDMAGKVCVKLCSFFILKQVSFITLKVLVRNF